MLREAEESKAARNIIFTRELVQIGADYCRLVQILVCSRRVASR